MADHFDAIVIGGGPGGSTTGLLLARAGWSVAVVERSEFPRRKVCGEYLSPPNLSLFRRLAIADDFLKLAGPPVRQVGLFAKDSILVADMPTPRHGAGDPGRALAREYLDTLLLKRAADAGASVWQPWSATHLDRCSDDYLCTVTRKESDQRRHIRAKVVIAAHGSWQTGGLPTQAGRSTPRASTLFGFKASFHHSRLPIGLMPLLAFPGGYGGMVHTDVGRVSLSSCVRYDALERCRRETGEAVAANAVLAHIKRHCRGVSEVLRDSRIDGGWLSVGTVRPGVRHPFANGVFCVGNAAGEAHPIIAEGISMAIHAASVLCHRLTALSKREMSPAHLAEVGRDYAAAWRRCFGLRIRVAAVFAHLATSASSVALLLPVFRLFPSLLTLGARMSGKVEKVATPRVLIATRPATG